MNDKPVVTVSGADGDRLVFVSEGGYIALSGTSYKPSVQPTPHTQCKPPIWCNHFHLFIARKVQEADLSYAWQSGYELWKFSEPRLVAAGSVASVSRQIWGDYTGEYLLLVYT